LKRAQTIFAKASCFTHFLLSQRLRAPLIHLLINRILYQISTRAV
jgi:hypothetical protein